MTLEKWLNIWLNKYIKYRIKIRTYQAYENICNNHLIPSLGKYELENLSISIIQDFISSKIEHGNLINKQQLSYNTVNLIVSVLKQALSTAYNLEIMSINFKNKLSIPHIKEKKIEIFDIKEQMLIESFCIKSIKNKPNYFGIILCLYTGLRIGELLSLTYEDIDFKNNLLSINKTVCTIKINNIFSNYVDAPKTTSSIRTIPLPKQLMPYLKQIKNKSTSKYLITTKNKNMVSIRSYQKTFKCILNKLNIKYRNFHSLRHTFATRAIELGIDVKSLSEILGHKNAAITLNRYSHSLLEYKKEMMNKLGKLLN